MTRLPHAVVLSVLALLPQTASAQQLTSPSNPPRVHRAFGNGPLRFEANRGQTDSRVRFVLRAPGYRMSLTDSKAILQFNDAVHASLRLELEGARTPRSISGEEQLPGLTNYLNRTPRESTIGVPSFARVRYSEVYDGIDLVYYGTDGQLEYDFIVAPGSDPSRIRFRLAGSTALSIVDRGDLAIRVGRHELRQRRPVAFQQIAGVRHEVQAGYQLMDDGRVGFVLGPHDPRAALTIDPVLVYSTYAGGGAGNSFAGTNAIAIDVNGAAFVGGSATRPGFPPCCDAFITKYDPAGEIVYSTVIELNGSVGIAAVAVDRWGSVYFTGSSMATNFPITVGPATPPCAPGSVECVAPFVAKLNGSGTALVFSRYFGVAAPPDGRPTQPTAIGVDSSLNVFLAGTAAVGFPVTPGAFQSVHPDPSGNFQTGFVMKFNATATAVLYSTYLGGPGDYVSDIAVDRDGHVYLTGTARLSVFPTTPGAFQSACPTVTDSGECSSAFVTKLNTAGSALVYSTYLGGFTSPIILSNSAGGAIAVDDDGFAYVTGSAYTRDFPTTPGSLKPTATPGLPFAHNLDAFVTKLNQDGSALVYSTYLGGDRDIDFRGEAGAGIAVDDQRRVTVVGSTAASDFPLVDPLQPALTGTGPDGFVATLNPSGSALTFASYFGGAAQDTIYGVAVNPAGDIFLVGTTASSDLPMVNAAQPSFAGESSAFVARIGDPPSCGVDATAQVQVFKSAFIPLLWPFTLQLVVVRNSSVSPIDGVVAYVMDDLQSAVYVGSSAQTRCFFPPADPVKLVPLGDDNVLAPGESVLMPLWFFQTQLAPIAYTPRVLSGYLGR